MSLTHDIKPGDHVDATEVLKNTQDLRDQIADVLPAHIEDYSIDFRHLTGTWKHIGSVTNAGPINTANPPGPAADQQLATGNFTVQSGEPVLIKASCQVELTATPAQVRIGIRVLGATWLPGTTLDWVGGAGAAGTEKFHVTIPAIGRMANTPSEYSCAT